MWLLLGLPVPIVCGHQYLPCGCAKAVTSIPKSYTSIVTALNSSIAAANAVRPAGTAAHILQTAQLVTMLKNEANSHHIIGEPKTSHYVDNSKSSNKQFSKKSNNNGKGKGKGKGRGSSKKKHPAITEKDATCFKCSAKGHKLNNPKCPQYGKSAKANSSSKGKGKELAANAEIDE